MHDFTLVLPDTRCRDGWTSKSSGPGTCSHHGGIDYNYSYPDDSSNAFGIGVLIFSIVMWAVVIVWWKRATRRPKK